MASSSQCTTLPVFRLIINNKSTKLLIECTDEKTLRDIIMNVGSNPGNHLYNIVQILYDKVDSEVSVTKVDSEVKTWTIVKSEIDPDDSVLRMKLWMVS